jgi:hypothetical protein
MVEHVDIPDGEIHEPKGISTATDGQTYVADGAGSGTWKTQGSPLFGDMDFTLNTAPTNITAVSATPGAPGFVLVTGATLTTPGPLFSQGVVDTISFENTGNNELLRVPQAGIYEISYSIAFSGGGGGGGNIYRFNVAINGVEQLSHAYGLRQTSSSDVGSVSCSEYFQLAANDTIQLGVANETGVNDPTISAASFTCILLKEV